MMFLVMDNSELDMTNMAILTLTKVWAASEAAVVATSEDLVISLICSSEAADAVILTHRSAVGICSIP
ncbi:hypothetical protein D3C75_603810 [compost metagenome]